MFASVVFDLDGTLLNTIDDLADSSNWVCSRMGWPTHTVQEYRYFVGNGIPKLVERFTPEACRTPETLARALALFDERYAAHKADKTAPYPGIALLLQHLQAAGVRYGVVTNKDHAAAVGVLQHYFGSLVPHVQGRIDALPPKPAPDTTHLLMKTLGAAPETTLFVGDSNVDIATAKAAGLASCGVLWGFRTLGELQQAGADHIAESPAALQALILGQ